MTAQPSAATVDLQVHSTASDGAVAPADIPALASAAQLAAIALTDHDSTAGVAAAQTAGRALGVRVVAGVELSVTREDRELHILGLHVEPAGALEERLTGFRVERATRAAAIVERLRQLGVAITLDDVTRVAGGGALGRPHVARALIAAGVCRDFREAFDRYIGPGRPAYVAKPKLDVRDAVDTIHRAGGLAIWAHPAADGRRDVIESLRREGLDGVEVLHPGHSADDVARLSALCAYLGLVPSGGSDWHGEASGRRALGSMNVPAEWLERQDARVASRRAAGRA